MLGYVFEQCAIIETLTLMKVSNGSPQVNFNIYILKGGNSIKEERIHT